MAEAVAAGVFDVDLDGPLCPDPTQVQAITQEQAAELIWSLLEIEYLRWCQDAEVDPATGHRPKTRQRREELPNQVRRALHRAQQKYQDCLAAYSDAFGTAASDALDRYVRSIADTLVRERDHAVQGQLF